MISTKNAAPFDADPYRSRVLQVQARTHFDVSDWHSIVAVTLTLKQAIQQHGYVFYGREENYTKVFECFMRRLNRAVYGNAARRFERRLRVIPIIEKDEDGRWHIHAAIEAPAHMTPWQFQNEIMRCWPTKNLWAYKFNQIKFGADVGWVNYLLKLRQKSGLEAWSDSIDWYSFYNPIVDG